MLEHTCSDSEITTSVGQLVSRVLMEIDDVLVPVIPLSVVAARMGYTRRRVLQLLDSGELIGVKVSGRWWVLSQSLKTFRASERQTLSVVSF